ncbi:unnamed protein product [Mycena citricolor]|uniref:alpha-amylase n=1 Tax=Mycena citricolor TaxID=2018698 RepID=A0AAD2K828_9AGAR|nr:unnamed protein product [Mycena citricolor]
MHRRPVALPVLCCPFFFPSYHGRGIISLFLFLSGLSAFAVQGAKVSARGPSKANDVIVQMFEWPWDSVASECSFLGSAGFGFVQVSPPTEHITGPQWFTDYQPVSYTISSKRGNRTQFANMVSSCNSAGVGIIADGKWRKIRPLFSACCDILNSRTVVTNHMTSGAGTGFAGTVYTKYSYPIYSADKFHYCQGGTTASTISNFDNITEVRTCELVGLADLAQEQPAVQSTIAGLLNDLLSLGVAGFRVDAAKHMDPGTLKAIFSQLNGSPYIIQEVPAGGASEPAQYTGNGDVIEFGATSFLQQSFEGSNGNSVSNLVTPTPLSSEFGIIDGLNANFIMANQDTERSGNSLTSNSANNAYVLSAIFMLGFNYGTPTVFSGYNFTSFDQGAPQDAAGFTDEITCFQNGFRCEHRFTAIANMVQYHNEVGSNPLTNIAVGTKQQVAFGRGAAGFLVVNNDATAWSQTFATSLPAGNCEQLFFLP